MLKVIIAMQKKKKEWKTKVKVSGVQDPRGQVVISTQVVRVELTEKVRSQQRCEESELAKWISGARALQVRGIASERP